MQISKYISLLSPDALESDNVQLTVDALSRKGANWITFREHRDKGHTGYLRSQQSIDYNTLIDASPAYSGIGPSESVLLQALRTASEPKPVVEIEAEILSLIQEFFIARGIPVESDEQILWNPQSSATCSYAALGGLHALLTEHDPEAEKPTLIIVSPHFELFSILAALTGFDIEYIDTGNGDQRPLDKRLDEKVKALKGQGKEVGFLLANPSHYNNQRLPTETLDKLAHVIAQHEVKTICDELYEMHPFDESAASLASRIVDDKSLYQQGLVMISSGTSKSLSLDGELHQYGNLNYRMPKLGYATTGNEPWMQETKRYWESQLEPLFRWPYEGKEQSLLTDLRMVTQVMKDAHENSFSSHHARFASKSDALHDIVDEAKERHGLEDDDLEIIGDYEQGFLRSIRVPQSILDNCGIERSVELQETILSLTGVHLHPLSGMGSALVGLRVNVLSDNLDVAFDRIARAISLMKDHEKAPQYQTDIKPIMDDVIREYFGEQIQDAEIAAQSGTPGADIALHELKTQFEHTGVDTGCTKS